MKLSIALALFAAASLSADSVRVLQSNSAGDNIHVIDPATNQVVGTIDDIEVPHGVVIAPDGARIYITNESLRTLDVVDSKTLKVTKRIPLSGRPNNLAVAKDGKSVYVAIVQSPGAVDVIDTGSMTMVKSVPTKGGIHNVYVTPTGNGPSPGRFREPPLMSSTPRQTPSRGTSRWARVSVRWPSRRMRMDRRKSSSCSSRISMDSWCSISLPTRNSGG